MQRLLSIPPSNSLARGMYLRACGASESLELVAEVLRRYGATERDSPLILTEFLRDLVIDEGPSPGDMLAVLNAMCDVFKRED